MAQLGDLVRAKTLVRKRCARVRCERAVARARCVVAEAEIALVSRDLGWPAKSLDSARATLEAHGDRVNAAHARYLEIRRLLLIGRLDEAEATLAELDPAPLPPASRTAHELVVAGIAMRRIRTKEARARAREGRARGARRTHPRADSGGRERIPRRGHPRCAPDCQRRRAAPPARGGRDAAGVESASSSTRAVMSCGRNARSVSLARRPVLFALARALGEAWPGDVAERRAGRARIRLEVRRRIASRAAASRNRAAAQGASDAGRRERDEARVCADAAARTRRRRAGAARRRGACGRARLPRRWRIVVELGAGAGAWRESAHRAAGARLACGGRTRCNRSVAGERAAGRPRPCRDSRRRCYSPRRCPD